MFLKDHSMHFIGRQAAWATPFLLMPAVPGFIAQVMPETTLIMNGAAGISAVQQAILGTYVAQKVLYVGPKLLGRGMDRLSQATRKKFPRAAKGLDKVVERVQEKVLSPVKDKVFTPIKNRIANTQETISKHTDTTGSCEVSTSNCAIEKNATHRRKINTRTKKTSE